MDPLLMANMAQQAGPFMETALTAGGQWFTNRSNKHRAREQMAFQERMSSSAYQRARADKEAAGINPLYGLAPASTPGGAMSTSQNEMAGVTGTTARSLEARALKAGIGKTEADTKSALALGQLYNEQSRQAMTNSALNAQQLDALRLQMKGHQNRADFENSFLGKIAPYLNFGLSTAKDIVGLATPVGRAVTAVTNRNSEKGEFVNTDTGEVRSGTFKPAKITFKGNR